jgi:hypothetical protein
VFYDGSILIGPAAASSVLVMYDWGEQDTNNTYQGNY